MFPSQEFLNLFLNDNPWCHPTLFEQIILELYTRTLASDGVAIDGGANIGFHTRAMARVAWRGAVHAFEPIPAVFGELASNTQTLAHVSNYNAAISDFIGTSEFTVFEDPAYSGLRPRLDQISEGMKHHQITVAVSTVDTLLKHIERLDFMKLDLEGAEYHALLGASRTIAAFRPVIALEDGKQFSADMYHYKLGDFFDYFSSLGYTLFDVAGNPYLTKSEYTDLAVCRPWCTIAFPDEKTASVLRDAINAACVKLLLSEMSPARCKNGQD